jgi:MFS transporter, DHA2 family, multidrug resistance protein
MTAPPHEYPKNKWLIAVSVTIGTLMGAIDTSIINVALPHLRGTLSATVDEISWVATGYIVAAVIVMPLTAWLGSWFGRKRLYMSGVVIFILGSIFCGLSRSLWAMVVFRIFQGIGAGILQPTEQAILRESFPPHQQGIAMSLFGFVVVLGPAIGPTLGGYIVDNWSWPWIFYINVPIGAIGLFMVWRVVHDPPYLVRRRGEIDYLGVALLVFGLGALQTLLEQGERNDWFDSKLMVAYALIAVVSLTWFVVHELETPHPAVNLRVLRDRSFSSGTAIGAVLGAVLFSTIFLLPIYMQELLGMNAMHTGLALMPRSVTTLICIPIVGAIYNRTSPRLVTAIGLALGGYSCIMMARFTLDTSSAQILWPQVIQGAALACIFIPLSTVALATIDRKEMGDATGLNNLVRQLGGGFGVAIFASQLGRFITSWRAQLLPHVAMGSPQVMARLASAKQMFIARGFDAVTAQLQALRVLDFQIMRQASMLAFEQAFRYAGILFLASVPLVLLLDEGRKQRAGGHAAVEMG